MRALAAATVLFCCLSAADTAKAQLEETGILIQAGVNDANLLTSEYLKPAARGFGAGLNSGWFNSAGTHKILGFDLTFRLNAAVVPATDKAFDISELGLQRLTLADPQNSVSPTLSGSNESGPDVLISQTIELPNGMEHTLELARFSMPKGSGFGYVPTPMLQASVGLPANTDIIVRLLPTYSVGDIGSVSLWGVGAKHGLNGWLPGGNLLPFDLSVMAGYTSFETRVNYEISPGVSTYEVDPNNFDRPETWEGQRLNLSSNAFTANVLIGKSLPVISFYAGAGIETSTMSIKTVGNYPFITPEHDGVFYTGNRQLDILTDPLDLQIKGSNTFRALAGIRLKLLILTLSADYTVADYSMASVGVGFSFR